jgi:L-threonylcarbamoyladenylate synthase
VKEISQEAVKMIAPILLSGGVGVLPTDTLYGLVGSALDKTSVERIYGLRKRDLKKPMIILIGSLEDIGKFGLKLDPRQKRILKKIWPGKVSVVLECPQKKYEYMHRGTKTVALRLPEQAWLRNLLKRTGPLVAPSANLAGKKPAAAISEAKKYFNENVDFYVDAGRLSSKPSTLIRLHINGDMEMLRQGTLSLKTLDKHPDSIV